jgi:hypothetical protein
MFYNSQPLWTRGKWSIFQDGDTAHDKPRLVVQFDGARTALVDHPICYDCGTVAYDRPEAIPQRVKAAVERLYNPPGWHMLFHGGHSYSASSVHDDTPEFFDTLEAAKWAFESRTVGFDRRYPCTDETAEAWLFAADPRKTGCEYPDRIITLGPRNGVRLERV